MPPSKYPVVPAASLEDIQALTNGDRMNSVRAYLGMMRYSNFTIHQEMNSFLENQLVEARREDKDLDPSTMHTWLTVENSTT